MKSRLATITAAIGLACLVATSVAAGDLRIQFAEKVSIAASAGHTEFDAYGRRFSLDLQPNDRLLRALDTNRKQAIEASRLLRGVLNGAPGSWVRLARVGDSLEGAIWDGSDLYVVTSKRRIDASLTLPLEGAPSQTVVYRLSDTLGGLPEGFCGVEVKLPRSAGDSRSGLDDYKATVADLRANAVALAANEQLDIALIADGAFQSSMGSLASDSMLARLNTVDGIFSEQVGVMLVPTELRMVPPAGDPFTSTDAQKLLDQLADYRSATPAVKAAGLAHLMTGKNLNGNTVGIAYLDSLCDSHEGVSLSDSETGDFYSALVMAHELGHNFGAPHDGVSDSACASTPQNFLMAPEINGSPTFSQCSLNRIAAGVTRARGVCITSLHYADLALEFPPAPFDIPTQQEFSFPMTIRSVGNEAVRNAVLRVDLPPQITYQSVAEGACNASGSTVSCQVGDVPAGESRVVELRLASSAPPGGSYTIAAGLTADNDYVRSNNTRSMIIGLTSAVDLGIKLTASTTQVYATDTVDFTIDISSTRTQAAHGATVLLNLGAGAVAIESIADGAHTCATESGTTWAMRCSLADVPSGATTRITVHARALNPGPYLGDARIVLQNDGDPANDSSRVPYSVRAEREIVTTVSTENLRAVIGQAYDLVYTLTSVGRLAATDVTLTVGNPLSAIESVVPSAGACSTPGTGMSYTCDFGALNPGDVRTVTVRVRFAAAATTSIVGATEYTNGSQHANAAKFTWVYANLRIDAQASIVNQSATLEGQTGTGTFELASTGIDLAQHVVAVLEVPAPIRLLALRLVYNPHGFQCVIETPQRARCTGSYGAVDQASPLTRVQFDFTADDATTGDARLALTADGDGNAANDTATVELRVNPYIDVGISLSPGTPPVVVMDVGTVTPVNLVLATGRNPATHVYVSATGLDGWYRVDSISVNGADCARGGNDQSEFGNFFCEVGTVPANSSYPVIVRYRASRGGVGQGGAPIYASAASDASNANNVVYFNTRTRELTDIRLAVAQPSASAVNGAALHFPLITISNTGAYADDIHVDIPLPAFATVDTVSSSGYCTGDTTLQCSFDALESGASATIDLSLRTTAAGSFTSNVMVVADNDSTAANNSAAVAVTVTAAPASSSPGGSTAGGSGKSGGGGRIEWLAIALLAALVARRLARRAGEVPRHPARATRH